MTGKFSFSKKVATCLSVFSIAATIFFGSMSNANATINYAEEVAAVAHSYVGSPFKYEGSTPKGFDASGFTQYIFKN